MKYSCPIRISWQEKILGNATRNGAIRKHISSRSLSLALRFSIYTCISIQLISDNMYYTTAMLEVSF